jgi:hypothetical protein
VYRSNLSTDIDTSTATGVLLINRIPPTLHDLRHIKLCYSKETYCGHPRQSGMFYFGSGEIVVMHSHASSRYEAPEDVSHSFTTGYASRASILLQRSMDGGKTWPTEHDATIWKESRPLEEKRDMLANAGQVWRKNEVRIDLISPDSAYYFARAATGPAGPDGLPTLECRPFYSNDRGETFWIAENPVLSPAGYTEVHRDGHPLVVCPDGTLLGAMSVGGQEGSAVALYGSDDNGLTWEFLAQIATDPTGKGRSTYAGLTLLPSGRLQCYMLNIGGIRNAIQMAHSDDGGYSWSEPRPIVAWGSSPWAARRATDASKAGVHYRSSWPMRLRDGRTVVLFGRRKPPFGIGLIVSEDDGETWSTEAVVRDDGSGPDLGYPVATELDDGRIFTAYYFMEDDGNGFGGTRFIAGSFFRID